MPTEFQSFQLDAEVRLFVCWLDSKYAMISMISWDISWLGHWRAMCVQCTCCLTHAVYKLAWINQVQRCKRVFVPSCVCSSPVFFLPRYFRAFQGVYIGSHITCFAFVFQGHTHQSVFWGFWSGITSFQSFVFNQQWNGRKNGKDGRGHRKEQLLCSFSGTLDDDSVSEIKQSVVADRAERFDTYCFSAVLEDLVFSDEGGQSQDTSSCLTDFLKLCEVSVLLNSCHCCICCFLKTLATKQAWRKCMKKAKECSMKSSKRFSFTSFPQKVWCSGFWQMSNRWVIKTLQNEMPAKAGRSVQLLSLQRMFWYLSQGQKDAFLKNEQRFSV